MDKQHYKQAKQMPGFSREQYQEMITDATGDNPSDMFGGDWENEVRELN